MDSKKALEQAQQALAAGRWEDARARFDAVLKIETNADALRGLGDTLWWLGDASGCVRCMERAYSLQREEGDFVQACICALWLAGIQLKSLGNRSACSGWISTAERLVEQGGWR